MSTGSILRKQFQAHASGAKGEIALFRAFIQAFNSLGKESISKEFHGNKYQVTFSNGRGAGRPNPRCELCDVAIIQYKAGEASSARITFNQAKVTSRTFGCGVNGLPVARYKFSADLEQWDLLSNRPHLSQAVSTFLPPKTLLSDAVLPSVGSFGVFYPVGTTFEYAYFVADQLYPVRNNDGKGGVLQLTKPIFAIRSFSGFDEISGTCCFRTFGDALEAGLVGTPIRTLIATSDGTGRELRNWFGKLINGLQQEHPDSDIPSELFGGLELEPASEAILGDNPRKNRQVKAVVVIRTGQNKG